MEENRKIDELFRKKVPLKEETPPEEVWNVISARLSRQEKNRRFFLPIWYRIAGIAAVFVLIFTVYKLWERPINNSPSLENQTVKKNDILQNRESHPEQSVPKKSEIKKEQFQFKTQTAATATAAKRTGSGKAKTSTNGMTREEERSSVSPAITILRAKKRIAFGSSFNGRKADCMVPILPKGTTEEPVMGVSKFETDEGLEEITTDALVHNKFSISPVIAAVYYGNFGDGNALDNKLADNRNSGEIQTAYGISVGYQVSQRLKVRSGFNNISLNSNTQNVENSIALNVKTIDLDPAASFGIPEGIGNLNQHLVFLEIPLEVEYALVNKRFGINIITGASTFFLKENKTTLISSGLSHPLGPANNLNKTSFSANLGLGFTYHFSPKFYFTFDPIFKYQLNMYDNVQDLQPYHFGVYSGIHFRF